MWKLKACPRCSGDLYWDREAKRRLVWRCLLCGWDGSRREAEPNQITEDEVPAHPLLRLSASFWLLAALQALDGAQTILALTYIGASELMPVGSWAWATWGAWGMFWLKLGAIGCFLGMAWHWPREMETPLYAIVVLSLLVVLWNAANLLL